MCGDVYDFVTDSKFVDSSKTEKSKSPKILKTSFSSLENETFFLQIKKSHFTLYRL